MNSSYIGITDFTHPDQVKRMLKVFMQNRQKRSSRKLHVGVMMSRKTLNGLPTEWSSAFPANESIRRIFYSDETFNCLHYADYEPDSNFQNDLVHAIEYGGAFIDALQLDMIWPDPVIISTAVHMSRKFPRIILQVGANAINEAGGDHNEIVRRIDEYSSVVHYVLLDKSMGKGLGMNTAEILELTRVISQRLPQFKIAVAGGLGPETMHLVEPIVKEFPDISIDAQGRLRPSGNALDPIDWDMAESYLIEALKILR